jgi:hypothetical protein
MEFLEIEFSDRYCKKRKITVPYTEIIAWEENYYESDDMRVFTPITRTPIPGLLGMADMKGATEYLKWKNFLSRTK